MGLELRKGRDGKILPYWYGRVVMDGKARVFNLGVLVEGNAPPNLRLAGDAEFEASRAKAQERLENSQTDARIKGASMHLTARLIEAKTGHRVEYVKLADLPAKWRKLGRETQPTPAWLAWCDTIFTRFAESLSCAYLHEVTPEQATAYVEGLRTDFTRRTANGAAALLKSAFARLLPPGAINPFGKEIARRGKETESDTIHRRPLTATELVGLFETARPDPLLYPLTVCAACTGLRIGDVCQLSWKSVDLRAGVVAVRTSKTGKAVEIPIFKPLREVLETALADKGESPFVWPEAAYMYKKNRYGITYRGKVLFARAFAGAQEDDAPEIVQAAPDKATLATTLPRTVEAVRGAGFAPAKRDRILDTLTRYSAGTSYRQIEAETGRQRGQISEDLREAEKISGLRLRHGVSVASKRDLKTLIAATRQKRGGGKRKLSASLLGWHALRGTWATLALSAGIPIETVKLVTGHGTTNTVLKYYYNPQREHLRAILGNKLPGVLTGVKQPNQKRDANSTVIPDHTDDRVKDIVEQLKGLTKADRARLVRMMKGGFA